MILPFIHKTAAGLLIEEDRLLWVRLAHFRGRLTHLTWDEEAIENGEFGPALDRLALRIPLDQIPVTTSLPAIKQRVLLLKGPVFEHTEEFDTWLASELKKGLPAGADPDQFSTSCQILSLSEDTMRCLVLIARKEAATVHIFFERGFQVSHLSTPLAGAHRLLELGQHTGDAKLLLLDSNQFLSFSDGCLTGFDELYGQSHEELRLEVEHQLSLHGGKNSPVLLISGEREDAFVASLPSSVNTGILSLKRGETRLPGRFAPAAALALAGTMPGSANILPYEVQQKTRESVEKAVALHVLIRLGAAVLLLLLTATTVLVASGHLLDSAAEAQSRLATELSQIESARARLRALESDLAQAKRLSLSRSNVAGLLAGIAAIIPSDSWITSIESSQERTAQIAGIALNREEVTRLLRALEGAAFCDGVRLIKASEAHRDKLFPGPKRRVQQDMFTVFELALLDVHQITSHENSNAR